MLYLMEEGDAHYRNGNLGPALKKYIAIQKVRPAPLGSFPPFVYEDGV